LEGIKINLNWKAIITAFLVIMVISIISGLYLPNNVGLIGPIIGGLIAGYMVGGKYTYTKGIVNGGIPAGIAGFVSVLAVVLLSGNPLFTTTVVTAPSYTQDQINTLTTFTIIVNYSVVAMGGFILFFILGLLGEIIGVAIKGRGIY
jgi:hypothetical protein